jgi:hypothetical protein
MKYKVEQEFSYGWDDAPWSVENPETGETEPDYVYPTRELAQTVIDDLVNSCEYAVLMGDMDEALTQSDFRIVEVDDNYEQTLPD